MRSVAIEFLPQITTMVSQAKVLDVKLTWRALPYEHK